MELGQELNIDIDKLTSEGKGLAKFNNFVIFVDDACPGDKLKIKITKLTKSYANAKILEIIEPSTQRVKPFCPMQKICGACQLQYISYDYQLKLKQQIVQDTMHSIASIDIEIPKVIESPDIKEFRHKIQYPVTETKTSKRILAGYYKQKTHEIVNIKYCPIQPEICDKIMEYIKDNCTKFGITGYIENKNQGDLKHIVIRHSVLNKNCLVILVINSTQKTKKIVNFANKIFETFKEVSGVCINYNRQKTNIILGQKTECIIGIDYIEEKLTDKKFIIGAETFFQVNPRSANNIFEYVKEYITNNFEKPLVLDAYAGISAFGICVSDVAQKVVTIEENKQSTDLAEKSLEYNNISNVEIHNGDAGEFFSKEKRVFDVIILDPPRKGCTVQSLDNAYRLCKDTIIYVSCNPATLARDLKYLLTKDCKVKSIQPFDMFCHTYHIENVAIIKVNKY